MNQEPLKLDRDALPEELRRLLSSSLVYDRSFSAASKTYFVDGPQPLYLKLGDADLLERESEMSTFLHRHDLSPEVIMSGRTATGGYLVTRQLAGENGISAHHRAQPERLAVIWGEILRRIHSLPTEGCPYPQRQSEYVAMAETNARTRTYNPALMPEPFEVGLKRFQDFDPWTEDTVVLHGDYCLPNIILDDFSFRGVVDLGNGGLGDRHYDLYWGIWALEYNLGTDDYRSLFLDSYGRDGVNLERLEYSRLLSALMD